MPIMAPLADLLGVSRQTSVLAFQLGDEALGKLAAIGQLLLRQIVFLAETSQFAADVDAHKNASRFSRA